MKLVFRVLPLVAALVSACLNHEINALTLGVNAGVSTRETPSMVREKYQSVTVKLSRSMRESLEIVPVRSSSVGEMLKSATLDAMIVHTHTALADAPRNGWVVRAVSSDATNNRIHFLVGKNVTAAKLSDVSVKTIVFPGRTSFATVAARAEAAKNGIMLAEFKQITTQYQDSLPFYLDQGLASIGVTRLTSVADDWKKQGGRVLHSSEPLPVYALVVNPQLAEKKADQLVYEVLKLEDDAFTSASGIRRFVLIDGTLNDRLGAFFKSGATN
jgi:phosphonate transport system substrate-binding protein